MFDAIVRSPEEMFAMGVGDGLSVDAEATALTWLAQKTQKSTVPFAMLKAMWWESVLLNAPDHNGLLLWANSAIQAMQPSSKL